MVRTLINAPQILFAFVVLWFSLSNQSIAQDTLFTRKDEKIACKILEIGTTEIGYRKFDYMDGPLYKILKKEVRLIRYQSGAFEIIPEVEMPPQVAAVEEPKMLGYHDGYLDADRYYRGYKGAGTLSYISGLFVLYGLPVPIISSLVKPTNTRIYVPRPTDYQTNAAYAAGFNQRATSMKRSKVWANYGYGVGTVLILLIALTAGQ